MTATTPDTKRKSAAAVAPLLDRAMAARAARKGGRTFLRACAAIGLALVVAGFIILLTGKNPLLAYAALIKGAAGSTGRLAFALNKSTPYILAGVGVALCFRAKIINIGAEGQIAVGGIAAACVAL